MQTYEVRISNAALADMDDLRRFLDAMMSEEGAIRYANNMRTEIKMLAFCAVKSQENVHSAYRTGKETYSITNIQKYGINGKLRLSERRLRSLE